MGSLKKYESEDIENMIGRTRNFNNIAFNENNITNSNLRNDNLTTQMDVSLVKQNDIFVSDNDHMEDEKESNVIIEKKKKKKAYKLRKQHLINTVKFSKHRFEKDILDLTTGRNEYFLPHAQVSFFLRKNESSHFQNSKMNHTLICTINPLEGLYGNVNWQFTCILPEEYPFKPPVLRTVAPLFHPNIDYTSGIVKIPMLCDDWSPVLTLRLVILSLVLIFVEPNHENCANQMALESMKSNFDLFKERVEFCRREVLNRGRRVGSGKRNFSTRPNYDGDMDDIICKPKRRFRNHHFESYICDSENNSLANKNKYNKALVKNGYKSNNALIPSNIINKAGYVTNENLVPKDIKPISFCFGESNKNYNENNVTQQTTFNNNLHSDYVGGVQGVLVQKLSHCSLSSTLKKRKVANDSMM